MRAYPFTAITNALLLTLLVGLLLKGHAWSAETKVHNGYSVEACIACHRTGSSESSLHITVEEYAASVHSRELTCLSCHTGVVDNDHQSTPGSGAVDCGTCHEQENRHGLKGPAARRPQCHSCHTRHHILSKTDPASATHPDQLAITCAGCHPGPSGETGFFSWFPSFKIASHNKADLGASYSTDNCIGCHQGAAVHGEPIPIDEQNCARCHLSTEADNAMWGYIHPQADISRQPPVFIAASIYQCLVFIGMIVLLGRFLNRVFRKLPGRSKRNV